jgi:TolA-binding protein
MGHNMTADKVKSTILKDWPSRLILTALIAFAGFAWSQSKVIVHDKVIEIVQPSLDSITRNQEMVDQRVEVVQQQVEKLNGKLDALISILVESSPQIKRAAQNRIQKNKDSQDVQNSLNGSTR